MKKLDVPLVLQAADSKDCGPACVEMILRYFGMEGDIQKLASQLEYFEVGTSAYDNGRLLLDAGLNVEAITRQPLLFSPDTTQKITSGAEIAAILQNNEKRLGKYKSGVDKIITFLDKGGTMRIEIPDIKHIREAIDQSNPIIALLYARALGSNEGNFHFVIVDGYDEEKVHITNPYPKSHQQDWFPVSDFLYGLYSSTTADIDNGTLLVVSN
jgi:hypothetical protein